MPVLRNGRTCTFIIIQCGIFSNFSRDITIGFYSEVISLVLLFQYNSYQGSVWFSTANAINGRILTWNAEVESFFSLSKANEELTQRNLYLEQQVRALTDKIVETTQDSGWIKRGQLSLLKDYRLIPAKVVSNTLNRHDNLITIDKGYNDGVRKDMGVACGNGVVGIVYLTSSHYSVVIPVLNTASSISCAIHGRGYFGYLNWTGGDTKTAYVDDIHPMAFRTDCRWFYRPTSAGCVMFV